LNDTPGQTTIPTAAMETGDFSALADAANDPIIFDPANQQLRRPVSAHGHRFRITARTT
jgi:hypothetical protein